MRLDFWNNPLVVSAVRLKFRRNSPALMASIWVMALLTLGGAINYYAPRNNWPFAETYLTAILGVQFIISGGIALFATSSSINAEVTTRTLDFQRIVSLSPQAILVGKMLGEPAFGYLLAIASIPLAAICCGLGAVSPLALVMLYVNLLTFMLMFAAIGLIHTLTPPTQTDGRQRSSGGGIAFVVIFLSQFLIQGVRGRKAPGIAEAIDLLTPIGSMMALWEGDPWQARVQLWGLEVSSLVVVPVVQLSIAAWIVAAMSRRLKNPLDPMVTKWRGYVTVAVCDAVVAGACYARWRQGFDIESLLYAYCLAHVVFCVLLLFTLVPRRVAIISWLWRRSAKVESRRRDLLLGDRSEAGPAGIVLGLVGIAVLVLGLVIPVVAAKPPSAPLAGVDFATLMKTLMEVSIVTLVLVTAAAATHQLVLVAANKGGQLLYIVLLFLANGGPPMIGALLQAPALNISRSVAETITLLSPVANYAMNFGHSGQYAGTIGILALYGIVAVVSYTLLQVWLSGQAKLVERKLAEIGVAK